jgi:predicted MFS family arabinose efflux permease
MDLGRVINGAKQPELGAMNTTKPATQTKGTEEEHAGIALMAAMLILTGGHILANMLRTAPAVAIDLMSIDLGSTPQALAALTSAYHVFFALFQVPVGVALDRYSIRSVALVLLGGTVIGSVIAAFSTGPVSFFASQATLGIATSGVLMCPLTLAAKRLSPSQFGTWSGIILSVGNAGMLLSASPLAFVTDNWGWRTGYLLAAVAAIVIALLVVIIVPTDRPDSERRAIGSEMVAVLGLGLSKKMRGIVVLALVSLATPLVLRGLWMGPWLMDFKGLSRIDTGSVLTLFTMALVIGPVFCGYLDRKIGNRQLILLCASLLASMLLLTMALGAPGYPLAVSLGVSALPAAADGGMLIAIGLLMAMQPLVYAMTRDIVDMANAGKALSATNLAFFLGTALMQSGTGAITASWGLPAALITMSALLAVCSLLFFVFTANSKALARK